MNSSIHLKHETIKIVIKKIDHHRYQNTDKEDNRDKKKKNTACITCISHENSIHSVLIRWYMCLIHTEVDTLFSIKI